MDNNFTDEELQQIIVVGSDKAEEILDDTDKLEEFFEKLEKKLAEVPGLGGALSYIPLLASMIRSYCKREYREAPVGSIASIMVALIYFVSPIDIIPDGVPVLGFADDAAVIGYILKSVKDDIDDYKEWQKENGKRVLE